VTRKSDGEAGAPVWFVVGFNFPSMGFDNLSGEVQSQPEPAVATGGYTPLEPVEDERQFLRRDADTVIANGEIDIFVVCRDPHFDRRPGSEFDRVPEEAVQDFLQPGTVPHTDDLVRANLRIDGGTNLRASGPEPLDLETLRGIIARYCAS